MATIEDKARRDLDEARYQQRRTTEHLVTTLQELLQQMEAQPPQRLQVRLRRVLKAHGGAEALQQDCTQVLALRDDNYIPFMSRYFKPQRSTLFRLLRQLTFQATSQDRTVAEALTAVLAHAEDTTPLLPATLDLAWVNPLWRKAIEVTRDKRLWYKKLALEMCVCSYVVLELKTGDLAVAGSEQFVDYREQLLPWAECQQRLADYCEVSGLPKTAKGFVAQLQRDLPEKCEAANQRLKQTPLKTNPDGQPTLPRPPAQPRSKAFRSFEELVLSRLPERSLLDILWDVAHYTHYTRHFGPLSGTDPKLQEAADVYVVTNFAFGANLGITQTAKHLRGGYSPQQLGYVNRHHMSRRQLEASLMDVINETTRFPLIYLWGSGKRAIADGTHFETWADNLIGEMHIRYGAYGGIGYFYVSDTYQALFSRFITCGTYEAIHILDVFLENKSALQPNTIHADTHGQSAAVFGLAGLLGVELQPRIRNWQEVRLFRPDATAYAQLDSLFSGTIDWALIETHWPDLMQVVLSIQAGTVLPSTLLRKLSSYSRKK